MKESKPNLPQNRVKVMIVSAALDEEALGMLCKLGIEVILAPAISSVDSRLARHVDLGICHIVEGVVVACPSSYETMTGKGIKVIAGMSDPQLIYPEDSRYNVCIIGKYAVHNFKCTDQVLSGFFSKEYDLVQVSQAYAKCVTSVINEEFVITQDKGIAVALEKKGIDAMYIDERKIKLDGFGYGFIGGASSMIDKKTWILNGSLDELDSCYNIEEELKKRSIDILCLKKGSPVDVGSFIPIYEEET